MKKLWLILLTVIFAASLAFVSCPDSGGSRGSSGSKGNNQNNNNNNNNDNNNNNNGQYEPPPLPPLPTTTPATPPAGGGTMSDRNVMQYFMEEDILLGWNLGNTMDAHNSGNVSETAWNNPTVTQALFHGVKAQGIDIVRIPVTWLNSIGPAPNYTISPARLNRVAEVVNYAYNADLKVIINIHHDDVNASWAWLRIKDAAESTENMIRITDKFQRVWVQIAHHFKDYGEWLIFEGMNEVHDGGWGWNTNGGTFQTNGNDQQDIINEWNQAFTNAVRITGGNNDTRFLMYPPYNANHNLLLPNGRLGSINSRFNMPEDPAGEGRQIVSFHYYDPFNFAHDATTPNWGTTQQRNEVTNLFERFKTAFVDNDIPVIIGEMGPRTRGQTSDTGRANRLLYIEHVYGEAIKNGLVPVYWDDGGNFQMMNRNTNLPVDDHSADSFAAMRTAAGR
jgi:aryl-phospho-beta-D-glucosidase BglC (GH1 family)